MYYISLRKFYKNFVVQHTINVIVNQGLTYWNQYGYQLQLIIYEIKIVNINCIIQVISEVSVISKPIVYGISCNRHFKI